jgi:hypothetical protein
MLPNFSGTFPSDAADLERTLNESLERFFGVQTKVAKVTMTSPRQIEISASVSDLETVITQLARREASKQGVTVEEVRLNFREIDQRALEFGADVRAKKMFFAATVRIFGRISIKEQLVAVLSDLRCSGEGAIGSMACGFLAPQLAKLEGHGFPLTALSSGELSLRDVTLSAGERVAITAEFGA